MVDLALIAYSAIGTICAAIAIVLYVNRDVWLSWADRAVSSVLYWNERMIERGRAQKARRERIYHMSSVKQYGPVPSIGPEAVPGHGTAATAVDLQLLARELTEAQYIELGARLVDRRGKYVFSGKTLYKIAGGNHDEFLAQMRRWRGGETEAEPPVHVTPIVGRPTRAVFETDPDYPYEAPA